MCTRVKEKETIVPVFLILYYNNISKFVRECEYYIKTVLYIFLIYDPFILSFSYGYIIFIIFISKKAVGVNERKYFATYLHNSFD